MIEIMKYEHMYILQSFETTYFIGYIENTSHHCDLPPFATYAQLYELCK